MDDADGTRRDKGDEYVIRPFAENDRADVERLAIEGLLGGHVDHSGSATVADPHGSGAGHASPHSFWVVEAQDCVIGTIAMLDGGLGVGQLLQLRVAPAWKEDRRIARCLVSAAVECAKERGILKVVIESPGIEVQRSGAENSSIVAYLRALGFEYTRTHETNGRAMLEFYLNLYQEPRTLS